MKKPGIFLFSILVLSLLSVSCIATPSMGKAISEDPPVPTSVELPPSPTYTPFQPLPTPYRTFTPEPSPPEKDFQEENSIAQEAAAESDPEEPDQEILADEYGDEIDLSAPSQIRRAYPLAEIPIRLELAAEGLHHPVELASPPDRSGRLFILDQTGAIYLLLPEGELRQEPLLNLRGLLAESEENIQPGRLLKLVFHPDFAQNGHFFVIYTYPTSVIGLDEQTMTGRLSAFSMSHWSRFQADPDSEQILYELDLPATANGGIHLAINPEGLLQFSFSRGTGAIHRAMICFDPGQAGFPETICNNDVNEDSPPLDLWEPYNGEDHRFENAFEQGAVGGIFYQGLTFPSYQGNYIFASLPDPTSSSSRLFMASPSKFEDRNWGVAELSIANRTNGRLPEVVTGISQGAGGRLYILTSGDPALEGDTGKVYLVSPSVQSERSVIERPEDYLPLTHRYARVTGVAPVYKNLDDLRAGEPSGTHGGGSFWVSERNRAQVNGKTYYWVSWGWGKAAWISASYIRFDAPLSHLRGFNMQQRPGELLALTTSPLHVRSIPGLLSDETIVASLRKYDLVTIYERRIVGGVTWYRIGPDQWSHGDYLRVFTPSKRPEGVEPGEKWVEVNLAQQTVIAHEGDSPVFATLTSTGRVGFSTTKGLYQVWSKLREAPMQWLDARPPYSLANVPYIMYFNKDQGLHGAYWHDLFGSVRSAGCVNLSPHDAHWLFHWAGPELPPDQRILYTSKEDPGIWVWVHDDVPDLEVLLTGLMLEKIEWPDESILLP